MNNERLFTPDTLAKAVNKMDKSSEKRALAAGAATLQPEAAQALSMRAGSPTG